MRYALILLRGLLDCPECPDDIVAGASGPEQCVRGTVRSRTASEIDCPELVNVDYGAGHVFHGADKRARLRVECVDGAIVSVV